MDFQLPDEPAEEEQPGCVAPPVGQRVHGEEEIRFAFNIWDTDSSGKIKCSEIVNVFKAMNYEDNIAKQIAEALIKAHDLDKDGKLTYDEFKAALIKQGCA